MWPIKIKHILMWGLALCLYKLPFSYVPHLSPLYPESDFVPLGQMSLLPDPCSRPLLPWPLSAVFVLFSFSCLSRAKKSPLCWELDLAGLEPMLFHSHIVCAGIIIRKLPGKVVSSLLLASLILVTLRPVLSTCWEFRCGERYQTPFSKGICAYLHWTER